MRERHQVITDISCEYGCGKVAKFLTHQGKYICDESPQRCPVNRIKNSKGLKKAYASGKRLSGSENYLGLSNKSKNNMRWNKDRYVAEFIVSGKGNHKRVLLHERGHKCEMCGNSKWLNHDIPLHLDHKNGVRNDFRRSNLRLLCPNCHNLTKNFGGKNINKNKGYISNELFLSTLNSSKNIRQALIKLGLTPKASNYERAYRLLNGQMVE